MNMNFKNLKQQKWFVILMLVLLFPYGIFLMWKNKTFNPKTRIIISILFFFFVIGLFNNSSHSNQEYIINSQKEEETQSLLSDYPQEKINSATIVLEYDEVGEYGKKVKYDGEEYIEYFLPTGNYEIVEKKSKINIIYLESDSMHRNDEGFLENDTVNEILLSKSNNIVINEGFHIVLTIGTKLELRKMED